MSVVTGKELRGRREGVAAVTELLLRKVQLGLQSDLFETRERCRSPEETFLLALFLEFSQISGVVLLEG